MIPPNVLWSLRNDLPMAVTIAKLGPKGPPAKIVENSLRFLCPKCSEMKATVNPNTNLAHCFCCDRNFNNIDLLIEQGHDFPSAVAVLEAWLAEHRRSSPRSR